MNKWNNIWQRYRKPNFILKIIRNHFYTELERSIRDIVKKHKINRKSSLIEVGSGSGKTLDMMRRIGFINSIGVDYAKEAIRSAYKNFGFTPGKDVILADVTKPKMGRQLKADIVFSCGVIEHFTDPTAIINGIDRMSLRYILLVQPCQRSLVGLIKWLYFLLGFASWDREYYYSEDRYFQLFSQRGYRLVDFRYVRMKEVMIFLFDKKIS